MQNPYAKQAKPNKEELVLEYAPLVKKIANRLAARLPDSILRDDLIQAGMMGLLEAVEKFDPKQGAKFKTFAEFRIKGAMLDDLRSKDWIPRSVRENATKLDRAFANLRSQGIDHPTDKELAKELELKPKELDEFLDKARPIPLLSLEGLSAHASDEDEMNILDTLSDPAEKNPFEEYANEEQIELLQEAIGDLPEKEQLVLALYYNEDLNLKEIAAVMDLTESRVSQLRTKAISMLRAVMLSAEEE